MELKANANIFPQTCAPPKVFSQSSSRSQSPAHLCIHQHKHTHKHTASHKHILSRVILQGGNSARDGRKSKSSAPNWYPFQNGQNFSNSLEPISSIRLNASWLSSVWLRWIGLVGFSHRPQVSCLTYKERGLPWKILRNSIEPCFLLYREMEAFFFCCFSSRVWWSVKTERIQLPTGRGIGASNGLRYCHTNVITTSISSARG